jgi:hypothetical protein
MNESEKTKRLKIKEAILQRMTFCEEEELIPLYFEWLENERKLRELLNIPSGNDYIPFYRVPRCTCPKLDNDDWLGCDVYLWDIECPVHKKGVFELKEEKDESELDSKSD